MDGMDVSLDFEDVKELETELSHSSGRGTRQLKNFSARETGKWTDFFPFVQWLLFSLPRQVDLHSAQLHKEYSSSLQAIPN